MYIAVRELSRDGVGLPAILNSLQRAVGQIVGRCPYFVGLYVGLTRLDVVEHIVAKACAEREAQVDTLVLQT